MDSRITPGQDKIEAVRRMQAFIAAHIREPITQAQLARAADYSQFYAARIFKELVGLPPFEYIRRCRLAQAALLLRDERPKVIDVAFDYVFDSHEGFTRAFSKEFGINPKEYALNPRPVKLFMPTDIKSYYQFMEGKVEPTMNTQPCVIFTQVVDRPARKLVLLRGKTAADYFEYCDEVGCDVWGVLCSIKDALYEPIGMWLPDNLRRQGTSVYAQGVEVPLAWSYELPEGFETLDLPACKVLIFQGPPYDDANFMEAISSLWQQIKNFDPTIYGYAWDDAAAPRFQLEPMGYRGYIEGRPVKALRK
ncbi:MAG: helix-turn-helix domain-containing protein [Anaerolineae bacterium]